MPIKNDAGTADAAVLPDNLDLISRVHFAPREGRILLDEQRMTLMHASAFGVLRRELIEDVGISRARRLLNRMGYNSGANDAELARKARGHINVLDAVNVGPQLHMLEGIGAVLWVRSEANEETGQFYGEYLWVNSLEAEEHIRIYGVGDLPSCWMQLGYASGFTSRFMGRPILFRELECKAQGYARCRIVGKPVEEWDDADDELRQLHATDGRPAVAASGLDTVVPLTPLSATPLSPLGNEDVVGISAGFNAVVHKIHRVANTRATVLFLGESGVGKEVLAQACHRISPRRDAPFIAVNCAAIPENLVESELFGVERGAYTGATHSRPGRFERAQGGTLFLDEIGILSNTAQGKLLRALQEREIERVGGSNTLKVDVRVIAATNLDLQKEVSAGRFREDLYFRLNVFPIQVPALRERLEDIPVFMNYFLQKFCRLHERSVAGFTSRAIDAMLSYHWPGNIRELENLVERGVIMAPDGGAIDSPHLFSGGEKFDLHQLGLDASGALIERGHAAAEMLDAPDRLAKVRAKVLTLLAGIAKPGDTTTLADIEDVLVRGALRAAGGNLSGAGRLLGLSRFQMNYRTTGRKAGEAGAESETDSSS